MAHARRKFVELYTANKSAIAATALQLIDELYQVEHDIDGLADWAGRLQQRQGRSVPVCRLPGNFTAG